MAVDKRPTSVVADEGRWPASSATAVAAAPGLAWSVLRSAAADQFFSYAFAAAAVETPTSVCSHRKNFGPNIAATFTDREENYRAMCAWSGRLEQSTTSTFVPRLHYQLSKTCSRHIFSHGK